MEERSALVEKINKVHKQWGFFLFRKTFPPQAQKPGIFLDFNLENLE